jgi:hypothetical protein
MRGALFRAGIFSTPDRSITIRFPQDSYEAAHPGLKFHTTYFFLQKETHAIRGIPLKKERVQALEGGDFFRGLQRSHRLI